MYPILRMNKSQLAPSVIETETKFGYEVVFVKLNHEYRLES